MPDFEAAEGGWIGERRFGLLLNMSPKFALANRFQEGTDFVILARGQQLDAAVRQITHRTGDVESLGDLPDRITKADALDAAFVKNLDGFDHATQRLVRLSPAATIERDLLSRREGRQVRIRKLFRGRDESRIVRIQIELLSRGGGFRGQGIRRLWGSRGDQGGGGGRFDLIARHVALLSGFH